MPEQSIRDVLPSGDPVELVDEGVQVSERDRDVLPDVVAVLFHEDVPARPPRGPELVRVAHDRELARHAALPQGPANTVQSMRDVVRILRLHFDEEERGLGRPSHVTSFRNRGDTAPVEVLHHRNPARGETREPTRELAARSRRRERDDRAPADGR